METKSLLIFAALFFVAIIVAVAWPAVVIRDSVRDTNPQNLISGSPTPIGNPLRNEGASILQIRAALQSQSSVNVLVTMNLAATLETDPYKSDVDQRRQLIQTTREMILSSAGINKLAVINAQDLDPSMVLNLDEHNFEKLLADNRISDFTLYNGDLTGETGN